MSHEKISDGCGMVVFAFVVAMMFAFIFSKGTYDLVTGNWRRECIERGVAEYDSSTGQWKWKEQFQKPPEAP